MSFQHPTLALLSQSSLVGTLGWQALDSNGTIVSAFTKTNVRVAGAVTDYTAGVVTLPDTAALVQWGIGNGGNPEMMLTVLASEPVQAPGVVALPTTPPPGYGGATVGDIVTGIENGPIGTAATRINAVPGTGPLVIATAPASAPQCACYCVTRDAGGNPQGGIAMNCYLIQLPPGSGSSYGVPLSSTSYALTDPDETRQARCDFVLLQGGTYAFGRDDGGPVVQITIPAQTLYALPNTIGRAVICGD